MIKKWKKRGKLQFSIFWKIFAPLEAKMMKNDKNMIKKKKKNEKNEKTFEEHCNFSFFGKLQFSSMFYHVLSFFIIFYHFSSIPPAEAKMIKKWF